MGFPDSFALPSEEGRERITRKIAARRESLIEVDDKNLPLRNGVKFHVDRHRHRAVYAEESGQYTPINRDSIGYFIAIIETPAQCEAVISQFYPRRKTADPWLAALPGKTVRRLILAVEQNEHGLPLTVATHDVDEELLSRGCFAEDGYWFLAFAASEPNCASIAEYRYSINEKNRVAVARRVIIEGPRDPQDGMGLPLGCYSKEKQEQIKIFEECHKFLTKMVVSQEQDRTQ